MLRRELVLFLDELLQADRFKDYCPNGLQIEGKNEVKRLICGVSLSNELIDIAREKQADAILVHHGIFWNKDAHVLTGVKYRRIAKLINSEINLIAYHLPLDCHPELGNNAQLAKQLGITIDGQCSTQNLLWYGHFKQEMTKDELVKHYQKQTGHLPMFFGVDKPIKTIAWCTGGADSMFHEAIDLGVDCFISGEVSEPIKALAEESNVAYLAGGHYVTERYGIMALSKYINDNLNIQSEFIELYNPI